MKKAEREKIQNKLKLEIEISEKYSKLSDKDKKQFEDFAYYLLNRKRTSKIILFFMRLKLESETKKELRKLRKNRKKLAKIKAKREGEKTMNTVKNITEYIKTEMDESPLFAPPTELSAEYKAFTEEYDKFTDYLGTLIASGEDARESAKQISKLTSDIIEYGINENKAGVAKGMLIGIEAAKKQFNDILDDCTEIDEDEIT